MQFATHVKEVLSCRQHIRTQQSQNSTRTCKQATLNDTREWLSEIVHDELARLGGKSERLFLGGASQGCTVAMDSYFRLTLQLRLGGFVGNTGFVPSDRMGFTGANATLNAVLEDEELAARPLWIQCAVDDRKEVPWDSLANPSLQRIRGKLSKLCVREVSGRGHSIEDWEGHVVNDFIRFYCKFAYQ